MKDGYIKVACATPEVKVADCEYNSKKIIELIKKANDKEISLIVFPELCITSYKNSRRNKKFKYYFNSWTSNKKRWRTL